jgi:hypothetical protein
MSKTDVLEARRAEAAEALGNAGKSAAAWGVVDQIRQKALDFASQARDRAADVADQARARSLARAADLKDWAKDRAQGEVSRRRSSAADTLESLAEVLRPDANQRRRRKTLALVGGSGLALTAAVGIGVAVGFVLSRELKKRKAAADQARASSAKATPAYGGGPEEPAGYDAEVGAGLGAV